MNWWLCKIGLHWYKWTEAYGENHVVWLACEWCGAPKRAWYSK